MTAPTPAELAAQARAAVNGGTLGDLLTRTSPHLVLALADAIEKLLIEDHNLRAERDGFRRELDEELGRAWSDERGEYVCDECGESVEHGPCDLHGGGKAETDRVRGLLDEAINRRNELRDECDRLRAESMQLHPCPDCHGEGSTRDDRGAHLVCSTCNGSGSDLRAARGHVTELVAVIDAAHLEHQRVFSLATFGPGARTAGVLDHIRKELGEIADDPGDITEWADLAILTFDGALRAGHEPQQIIDAIKAKQAVNETRKWPDWRTQDPDKAIEHVRGADSAAPDQAPSDPKEHP